MVEYSHTDLADWLRSLAHNHREEAEVRERAKKLWAQWQSGIVPSPGAISSLRKLMKRRKLCARLNEDGSCDWLKKNAPLEHMIPPKPGDKAFCRRRETGMYEGCAGFRELKGDV